jgi:hypothetical protein
MKKDFYTYLTAEDRLQRACIDYAIHAHRFKPIALNTEHKRSPFERFLWTFLGGVPGTPDLFFPYPKGGKHGLFVELKTKDRKVFGVTGKIIKNKTHEAQATTLSEFRSRGYVAEFVFGFENFKTLIDNYAN